MEDTRRHFAKYTTRKPSAWEEVTKEIEALPENAEPLTDIFISQAAYYIYSDGPLYKFEVDAQPYEQIVWAGADISI